MYKRAINLMEAELGDELVALDPIGGACFGFNDVATSVWVLLDQPKSFEQLRDKLMAEYEVDPDQCDSDLRQLLDDLSTKGLVTASP